jgi:hypothetical protein
MIKLLSKCVLVAAVASFALAGTTTMSHAAKKKAAAKKPAAAAACVAPKYSTASCANGWCRMQWCGVDGKWYPSLMVCAEPFCPKG